MYAMYASVVFVVCQLIAEIHCSRWVGFDEFDGLRSNMPRRGTQDITASDQKTVCNLALWFSGSTRRAHATFARASERTVV